VSKVCWQASSPVKAGRLSGDGLQPEDPASPSAPAEACDAPKIRLVTAMSKYLMNKFIHHVNMNETAEKEYKSDPRAYVEKWEKGEKLKLADDEREALCARDYGKLYALGAHPFTLWISKPKTGARR
jgi:hypothetical protein